jgi:hypothetical protein
VSIPSFVPEKAEPDRVFCYTFIKATGISAATEA